MPEYLSPGVYVEEVDSGPRPIEGAGTATAAFVGFAPAGPANRPVLVTNWTQYVDTFGSLEEGGRRNPHLDGTYLSHAVYGYFLNGGGRCYITRIAPANPSSNGRKDETLQLPSKSSKAMPSLTVSPKATSSEDISVEVAPPSGDEQPEATFTLKIRMGQVEEVYENVNLGKRGGKNVAEAINTASRLITIVEEQGTGTLAERVPEAGTYVLKATPISSAPKVQSSDFAGERR